MKSHLPFDFFQPAFTVALFTVTRLFVEDKENCCLASTLVVQEKYSTIINTAVVNNLATRQDKAEKCDQAILRNALMNVYYDCKAKGFRTEDDSKNYREMHEAYNAIGGNSFIDSDVSNWFNALPLKPNDYENKPNKTTKSKKQKLKKETD